MRLIRVLTLAATTCAFLGLSVGAAADDRRGPRDRRLFTSASELESHVRRFDTLIGHQWQLRHLKRETQALREDAGHFKAMVRRGVQGPHLREDFRKVSRSYRRLRRAVHDHGQQDKRLLDRWDEIVVGYYTTRRVLRGSDHRPGPHPTPNPGPTPFPKPRPGHFSQCVDFAYPRYDQTLPSASAMDRARRLCRDPFDLDLAQFLYELHDQTLPSSAAVDRAARDARKSGVARRTGLIRFAAERYDRTLPASSAATRAVDRTEDLEDDALPCVRRMFRAYDRSLPAIAAMDRALRACRDERPGQGL